MSNLPENTGKMNVPAMSEVEHPSQVQSSPQVKHPAQQPPQKFILRATYVEADRLSLLSHLEVAHALERTVRRAGLPFAISQGFSPHMKIAFGAALPVGVGSTCEIFDLQLTRYVPEDQALAALQDASVRDLMVQEVRYIEPKAKAASVAYPVSVYRVRFSYAPGTLAVPEDIVRIRRKKEKTFHVADHLVQGIEFDASDPCVATFALEAHDNGALRADLLLSESLALYNAQLAEGKAPLEVLEITRIEQHESR